MTTHPDTHTPVLGAIEYLNPHDLIIEDNVRDQVNLAADFLNSLREHGVIAPVTAIRTDDGATHVRDGQCRTLGARTVGLATIPVYLLATDTADTDTDTAAVERIVHQIVANDRRTALTDSQRARAIQQMLDTGLSATKVAKKLSLSSATVKAAGVAAKSAVALDALATGQLDFQQAETLTEFHTDPDAVDRLLRAAQSGDGAFAHTVAYLRQARATAKLFADAEKRYTQQGYTVLADRPSWSDTTCLGLRYLRTADGDEPTEDTITEPTMWAVYLVEDYAFLDLETGEPVDSNLVDEDTRYNTNLTPRDGMRHYNSVTETNIVVPDWYCLNHVAAGLELCPSLQHRAAGSTEPSGAIDDSPQAQAQRQADDDQAQRRERRKVIVLNKLGEAAQPVRREYVTKLLARKTPPKGAATFVAHCLTHDHFILSQNHGPDITATLLGVPDSRTVRAAVADPSSHADNRAQVITLAIVLGALEARTDKNAWRNARSATTGNALYFPHTVGSDVYLRFLIETGYMPSPIEEVIIAQRTAEEVFDGTMAQD
jgi:ParB family chromosome partitioning protein